MRLCVGTVLIKPNVTLLFQAGTSSYVVLWSRHSPDSYHYFSLNAILCLYLPFSVVIQSSMIMMIA